jgi:pimeloyl-ACP methyl ester carboxylesterase
LRPSAPGSAALRPPASWAEFDATVVADYLAVIRHTCTTTPLIVAHQGGTSHGCRIAARLGDQTLGLLILSGGIPIVDVLHLEHMNKMTRIAAVACRYAPSIMETMMRAGIFVWQKRGPEKFLQQALANSVSDLATLENADCRTAMVDGALNMISQGSKTSVHDGMAAMADWTADYDAVTCPVKWLHGADDPVIHPKSIAYFLKTRPPADLKIIPNAGVSLLYSHPEKFMSSLQEFADFNP